MHPASLPENELLTMCQVRRQRRSGPGGQHRNKVETAVVVIHTPTGIRGEASERRSQEENRRQAMFRLRLNLAVDVREACVAENYLPSPSWSRRCQQGRIAVSERHDDFPALLAEALDVMAASAMDAKVAARALGCTPSQLLKLLQQEPRAFLQVNHRRREQGMPLYR